MKSGKVYKLQLQCKFCACGTSVQLPEVTDHGSPVPLPKSLMIYLYSGNFTDVTQVPLTGITIHQIPLFVTYLNQTPRNDKTVLKIYTVNMQQILPERRSKHCRPKMWSFQSSALTDFICPAHFTDFYSCPRLSSKMEGIPAIAC